jgi:two-component system nitrogen regulation response regulator GlnG
MPAGSILVADDDAAIRTVLNQALSRAGYEVRSTSNAATLWRWVSQGDGDLIITDVVMPDENAFDLLPRIKKMRPNLPVIVMSAQNTFMTAIRASAFPCRARSRACLCRWNFASRTTVAAWRRICCRTCSIHS